MELNGENGCQSLHSPRSYTRDISWYNDEDDEDQGVSYRPLPYNVPKVKKIKKSRFSKANIARLIRSIKAMRKK